MAEPKVNKEAERRNDASSERGATGGGRRRRGGKQSSKHTDVNGSVGQADLPPKSEDANATTTVKARAQKKKNHGRQTKEEDWRVIPPAAGQPHKKVVDGKEYEWCPHHKAWGTHTAESCRKGKEEREAATKSQNVNNESNNRGNDVNNAMKASLVSVPSICTKYPADEAVNVDSSKNKTVEAKSKRSKKKGRNDRRKTNSTQPTKDAVSVLGNASVEATSIDTENATTKKIPAKIIPAKKENDGKTAKCTKPAAASIDTENATTKKIPAKMIPAKKKNDGKTAQCTKPAAASIDTENATTKKIPAKKIPAKKKNDGKTAQCTKPVEEAVLRNESIEGTLNGSKKGGNGRKATKSMNPVAEEDSTSKRQKSPSNNGTAKKKNETVENGRVSVSPRNSSNATQQNIVPAPAKQKNSKSQPTATHNVQRESPKKSLADKTKDNEIDRLSAQLLAEQKDKKALQAAFAKADEQARVERGRADMLAKHVTSLNEELESATQALQKHKREAETHSAIQQQLFASVKKELAEAKTSLGLEQSKVKELEESLALIDSERKMVEDLQKQLVCATAVRESLEQELNENKLRYTRVKQLEVELREERAKLATKGGPTKAPSMVLRQELHDTQEKLKAAKKKNQALTAELLNRNKAKSEKKPPNGEVRGKVSLDAWVEKAAPPKRAVSMPPPAEVSLPGLSDRASLVQLESSASAPVHYEGVEDDADKSTGPLEDELAFIRSAFPSDEMTIESNQVTYTLRLPVDDNSEDIRVDISVILPDGYPSVGVDEVKVVINEKSTCSPEIRKIAFDALPELQKNCKIEARSHVGSAALLDIFKSADVWAEYDWPGVMTKHLSKGKGKSSKNNGGEGSFEICTFLIYTHHIIDPDKIQFVKKNASKLSLGGYFKIGKPGLILVEGTQSDCEALFDSLVQNRKKMRESTKGTPDSATFSKAGYVVRKAKSSSERVLPKKLEQLDGKQGGMDAIKDACEKAGLLGSLEEVCKR